MAKQPIHVIRFGFLKACIWHNRTRSGERYSVSVVRLYRDGSVWKSSGRLFRDDLPLLCKILDLAHTWIFTQRAEQRNDGKEKSL